MDQHPHATAGLAPADRQRIYEAVREMALRQRQAIEQDDLATFHALLTQRETLITRVAEGGAAHDPQSVALLREIMALDEENQRLLSAKIEEAQRELNAVRGGQQVLRSYSSAAASEARFVDRRG
jgi:hypothetical protein